MNTINNFTAVTVNHNTKQNGVELKFNGKPALTVLEHLKQQGFKWSRFNKVWYSKVSTKSIEVAASFGIVPVSLMHSQKALNDQQEADNMSGYIDAQERAMYERN